MKPPSKTMIVFATRWGAQFGGINSFNQDIVCAFAAACYEQIKTICVVLSASLEEIRTSLQEHQVHLLSLDMRDQSTFPADLECKVWQSISAAGHLINPTDTVWLGHDRITGAITLAAAKTRGGRSALIHHMSYSRYETFAENNAIAQQKIEEQKSYFRKANLLLAVGPLLCESLKELSHSKTVTTLIPGLAEIPLQDASTAFRAFLSGRLSDDARKIKQAQLGVAAFATAIKQASECGMPEALRSKNEPTLTLRGVNFGSIENTDKSEAENDLNLFAREYAGRVFALHALPFTEDRDKLFDELSRASVAMMPSWHEGFGLVAWEAIAAGVPLIISEKSGVYRLLEDWKDGLSLNAVKSIDVMGDTREPFFQVADVNTLTAQLMKVATDTRARSRAGRLREELLQVYTWTNCAKELAQALSWPTNQIDHEIKPPTTNAHRAKPITPSIAWLQLPHPALLSSITMSDSQLLRAEEEVVPFDKSQEPFLETQIQWATSKDNILIRLLIGLGGVGKTRLGLELCRRLQHLNWQTGFLSGEFESNHVTSLVSQIFEAQQPCCIVIDYAETRQPTLLSLLKALKRHPPNHEVRILLLARAGGEWWASLPGKDAECEALLDGPFTSGPFHLPALYDTQLKRQSAYQQALETYANYLSMNKPIHTPALNEEHFSRPLYIQMSALMTLRGERPKSAEALPRALVHHEQRYWSRVLSSNIEGDDHVRLATLLMTLTTLGNGLFLDREIEKIWENFNEDKRDLKKLYKALTPLYSERERLYGLRPDLIGEALVTQSLLSPKGELLLDTVLAKGSSRLRHSALTIISRILRNRPDISPMIEDALSKNFLICLNEALDVCISTPDKLSAIAERAYERLPKKQKSQAATLLNNRIEFNVLPLTGLKLLACTDLVEKLGEKAKTGNALDRSNYANALGELSLALNGEGLIEQSAKVSVQTIEAFRKLKKTNDTTALRNLSAALNNHSNIESSLGHSDKSLEASDESLSIIRQLSSNHPGYYDFELAKCLRNHASHLNVLGRSDEALKVGLEDLAIIQSHPNDSDEYNSNLSGSMANCASYLSACGEGKKAMEFGVESLRIRQKLAEKRPERFNSGFAQQLSNHSCLLAREGHLESAIEVAKQSVEIREHLAKFKPESFRDDLASSLNNLAAHLLEKGHAKDSSQIAARVIDISRELALARPKAYSSDLGSALNNQACILAELGLYSESVKYSSESVDIYRKIINPPSDRYVYRYKLFQWELLIWKWLASAEPEILEKPEDPIIELNIWEEYALSYVKAYSTAVITPQSDLLQKALIAWKSLRPAQQHIFLASYLVISSITDFLFGQETSPKDWREKMNTFLNNRQGSLPLWMNEISRRSGFDLMDYINSSFDHD